LEERLQHQVRRYLLSLSEYFFFFFFFAEESKQEPVVKEKPSHYDYQDEEFFPV
jgi:hypothetical protein